MEKTIAKSRVSLLRPLLAGASAMALLCAAGCGKKAEQAPNPGLPVTTEVVIAKDFPYSIPTFGSFVAINEVNVQAQVSGKIMEAKFKEGQLVKAGDILYVIDKTPYEAAWKAAAGTLQKDEGSRNYYKYLVDVNKTLAETDTMARQAYEQYKSQLEVYSGAVANDKGLLDKAAIDLGWCDVKAPIDGITGKQLVDPGNLVSTTSPSTLVNIKSIDPIYLDVTVPEKHFATVKEHFDKGHLKVAGTIQGNPEPVEGAVIMLENSIDSAAGTLSLRAVVNNPKGKIWPGQFASVNIILDIIKDAVLAPVNAVQVGQIGHFVYVMRDGKAELTPVVIGQSDADKTVILKGDVKPGDRVINVGTMLLSPGAKVIEAQDAMKMMAAAAAAKMKAAAGKQAAPAAVEQPKKAEK